MENIQDNKNNKLIVCILCCSYSDQWLLRSEVILNISDFQSFFYYLDLYSPIEGMFIAINLKILNHIVPTYLFI